MNRWALAAAAGLIGLILAFIFWQPHPFETATTTADSPKDSSYRLRLGHNMPVNSALHETALLYAQHVERKSHGKIHISIHPNQELGSDPKMVEMARRGTLDIILTPTAKMGAALPAMQYVDLPFYFPTREDMYTMLDGEPGQMLLDELKEIDLIGVTFWENGFKHFTANTPLHTPSDFEGKKFRIMESRLIQAEFNALGAKTLPIDFHKVRQALADGIVDGQENPLIAIKSMGIDEVQKHLTLSAHGYMGYVFCISQKRSTSLPSDLQQILYTTARELTPREREETHRRENDLLNQMRHGGITIHTLTPEAREALRRKTEHIPARFEEEIGTHILSKTEEMLFAKYHPLSQRKDFIVIGLDADLSMGSKLGGLAIKRGAQLAIDEINAQGGILGKQLILIAKDHRGIAGKGADNVRDFVLKENAIAVLGGVQSGVITESAKEAEKFGLPYLISWAAAAPLTDSSKPSNLVFRVSANDQTAVPFLGEYLLKHHHTPAIVYENSIWGRGALTRMQEILQERDKNFSDSIPFNIGQQSFQEEIKHLKSSGADSVLLIANAREGIEFINSCDRSKVYLPVVAHWGITGNRFFEGTQNALKRIDLHVFQTFSFRNSRMPLSKHLAKRYLERYHVASSDEIAAPSGVAQTYDAVHLLARAIQKAGTTDRAAVRNALEHLSAYEGAVRRYDPPFTPQRHDALFREDYQIGRFLSNGTIVPISERR